MEFGGKPHPLRGGDVIVLPPGVEHRAVARDGAVPYRRFVFWLSREFYAALSERSPDYAYPLRLSEKAQGCVFSFDVIDFNTLRGKLHSLLDEIHATRFGRDERISVCICDLLLTLARLVFEQRQKKTPREARSTYDAITGFVEQHLSEELSLDRLSRELFLSKYYISHLFQENTGLSLHQYITKKRLAAAADAIKSGAAATEASRLCGFQEYTSFYRAFRKEYGVGPKEYGETNRRGDGEARH